MEIILHWLTEINDWIWTYILIGMLLLCAVWFTIRTRFVQFRMLKEMVRLLGDSTSKNQSPDKHVSSFQAFAISIASRVGTGNLAGVAMAIAIGGPGAVFWMWVIALLGASSAFIESTLAQLYKVRGKESFIGGPAYYMKKGLGLTWMGVAFAVIVSITFGFAFNSVQSNTLCAAWQEAFNINAGVLGGIITVATLFIIFGGIHRIAKVSGTVVPLMAVAYILLALVVVAINFREIPVVFKLIIENAFDWGALAGGGFGATLMQGIKRGLFSNEAGMGSAPNVAATADVTHPVKQGLIQTFAVFTDTIVICSCTAFIILFSHASWDGTTNGIQLTQQALENEVGGIGSIFVAVAICLFAFSSIIGNYYYGEANIRFITKNRSVLQLYRVLVAGMVFFGAVTSLDLVWGLADITMAFMVFFNLIAIVLLGRQAFLLLKDYWGQKRRGVKDPVYENGQIPELKDKGECW